MKHRLPLLVLAGLLAGALVAFALVGLPRSPEESATVSGKALVGGPFTLTDQNGKRVSDTDFHGRYMLVFFGFTHCPDICPSGLQVMSAALDKLGDKGKDIVPVFITLDPERDTPDTLRDYLKSFGDRFVGLTGSKEEVAAAAKTYRVFYQVVPDDKTAGDYSIDHAAIMYVMGKNGEYVTHIPHTINVDQVVAALQKIL